MATKTSLPLLPSDAAVEQKANAEVKQDQPVEVKAETKTEAIVVPLAQPITPAPSPVTEMPKAPTKPEPKQTQVEQSRFPEPKPQKIIVEHKSHGCGCRTISCSGCLLFLVLLAALVYVLIARPPFIMNPVKTWLNDGLQAAPGDGTTSLAAYASLAGQASNFRVGDNDLVIMQNEMQAILQDKAGDRGAVQLQILPSKVKVFIDGDPQSEVPLWWIAEIGTEDGQQLKISKLGTERVGLPAVMNEFITRVIFSIAGLVTGNNTGSENLLGTVIPLPENVQLKAIKLEEGKMTVTLTLASGFEDLFSLEGE
jgi:hypothetical protein